MPLVYSASAAAATSADALLSPEVCLPPELAAPFMPRACVRMVFSAAHFELLCYLTGDPIPMNSFSSKSTLTSNGKSYEVYRLKALEQKGVSLAKLPYSLRILLENLLRQEDGKSVTAADIEFLAKWHPKAEADREIAFMPARVLMQDFTGVPAIVDLAAMRDAMKKLGGKPEKINPLQPAELVIDHSVQVDEFGTARAYDINAAMEFTRNRERYAFLKWGQSAFDNFSAVPPGMGICHQVNLEYLARVVFTSKDGEA